MEEDLAFHIRDVTLAFHIRDITLAFPHAHLVSLIVRCLYKDFQRSTAVFVTGFSIAFYSQLGHPICVSYATEL